MEVKNGTIAGRPARTAEAFREAFEHNLWYTRGQAVYSASSIDAYMTLAYTVRDHLIERWRRTVETLHEANPRFVCFLSAEYLPGRQLSRNLLYSGTEEVARSALAEHGLDLADYLDLDPEPGLGNGGLGRLAACFLDSLATLDIPAIGYGIRYEFGIFRQEIRDGWQVECPDDWLRYGNPWEFPQPDDRVEVRFGGRTEGYRDERGAYRVRWVPSERVLGEPYHTLVPGYGTGTVNLLRLWRARASKDFDFQLFDVGDYARAVEQKVWSENISKVLYPNDHTPQGKALRLKQQYFFVACSLKDIVRLFVLRNDDWDRFPEKVAIQLNDTHPVIAVAELMRILVDEHRVEWERAWDITVRVFASTQHTLLPEAMEKWPVSLLGEILPRHLEIIYEVNRRFLEEVRRRFPGDEERLRRLSIVEEGAEKQVRMAHLACVGSHSINGVAELQSRLLRERVLPEFHELWPERFTNVTNGVSPRRFLRIANPRLSELITSRIGEGWLRDLERLRELEAHIEDPELREAWRGVKQRGKRGLAAEIRRQSGLEVDPAALFDVMVKRLHEYKRQLLQVLHIVTLYRRLRENPRADVEPRVFVFAAKAAPGYRMAKLVIKLINAVAEATRREARAAERLRVAFLENFRVTLGELVYPAADLSEQISLAGKEASGTGNMKFALNGALTIGTLDGANIEIRERVGEENFYLFGLTAEEVFARRERGYRPRDVIDADPELAAVLDLIESGHFSGGDRELFRPIVDSLRGSDEYLLLADYRSYLECQERVSRDFRDRESWTRRSILNTARSGFFSSDRAIREYAERIWRVAPVPVPV